MEDMMAWCLSDLSRWLELFNTNRARLLILLELSVLKFLLGQKLGNESQFLFVLLFEDPLGVDRVMHSRLNILLIIYGVIVLRSILAEDTE